jgi:hypothetical protein
MYAINLIPVTLAHIVHKFQRLQELNETRILAGQQLLQNYISLDIKALGASIDHIKSASDVTSKIDPEVDAAVFVRKAIEKAHFDKDSQAHFTFMPWNGGGNPSVIIDRVRNFSIVQLSFLHDMYTDIYGRLERDDASR